MGTAQGMSGSEPSASGEAPRRTWWTLSGTGLPTAGNLRSRRVLLMLVLIWIVAVFDYVFTRMAMHLGDFQEANPLARQFIHCPVQLSTFKFGTLAGATAILLAFSRHRITEIGCWFLGAIYAGLAVLWLLYFCYVPG